MRRKHNLTFYLNSGVEWGLHLGQRKRSLTWLATLATLSPRERAASKILSLSPGERVARYRRFHQAEGAG